MKLKFVVPMMLLSSLVLSACGGGGGGGGDDDRIVYTGSRSPATVSAANARSLAVGATGGASQAIAADSANSNNPLAPRGITPESTLAAMLIARLQATAAAQARNARESLDLCDSGSAELDQNSDGTRGSIEFSKCRVIGGDGAVLNGKVTFNGKVSGNTVTSLKMRFIDFRVSYLGESHRLNMTVACSGNPLSCDVFSDFVGLDGKIYRVELTLVINFTATSFDVDAVVFHPKHGFYTIAASLLYNDCPDGVPQSGTIMLTGAAASSASVVFNDCDSFTVTHLGVPTTYFWVDIL